MINESNYNYGVDLLKIYSMIGIIILHILGHGALLYCGLSRSQYIVGWIIELFCYCSVDCFALISGFVGYHEEERKRRSSHYIELWMQVLFYSAGITIVFFLLGKYNVGISDVLKSFLPVTFSQYWYFAAYTGLFILMPFIDEAVRSMNKDSLKKALLVSMLVFSVYGVIGERYSDPFKIHNGFSAIWLCYLYLIGAYIKKYEINKSVSKKRPLVIVSVCYILQLTWFFCLGRIFNKGLENLLFSYISPIVLGMAIGLLVVFGKLQMNRTFRRIIKFLSPTIFGVYLIHVQIIIYDNIISGNFVFLSKFNAILMAVYVIAIAILIFIICVLIERMRLFVFKILHLKQLSKWIESRACLLINKILQDI